MRPFLLFLLFTSSAFANTVHWRVNRDHSEVFFKVRYLTVSEVTGWFTHYLGRVEIDQDTGLPTKIHLQIHTKSVFTGNKIRDGHLKSKDFFYSKKYPHLTFESEQVSPVEGGTFMALGKLTIKDRALYERIEFKLTDGVKDTWGYKSKFVTFKFQLNRKVYGINWNKTLANNKFLVGDEVETWGRFQLQPLNLKTPTSKHTIPDKKSIRLREKLIRGEISQEEFNKIHKQWRPKSKKVTTPSPTPKAAVKPSTREEVEKVEKHDRSFRDTSTWWISYYAMGIIGFLAALIVVLQGKFIFLQMFPKKYEEAGFIGLLSDFAVYPLFFIYVAAMWYLGFG